LPRRSRVSQRQWFCRVNDPQRHCRGGAGEPDEGSLLPPAPVRTHADQYAWWTLASAAGIYRP
jgi:hypothetical protein